MVCRVGIIQPAVWMVWLSGVAASQPENSLTVASIMTSLIGRRGQAVHQFLTVRQRDFEQESARIAVAKRRIAEHRVISGLKRAFCPARARQNSRTRHFEDPRSRRLASLDVRFDDKSDVGVGPVDGLDGAFHGLRIIEVVGRIRMVCRGHPKKTQKKTCRKQNSSRQHLDHPHFTTWTEPYGPCGAGMKISLPNSSFPALRSSSAHSPSVIS